jgi:pimeloyl-ACP methyl ester carboxylesterase
MSTHQTAKTQYVVKPSGEKYGYRRLGTGFGTPIVFLIHFRGTMDKWDPLLVNNIAACRQVILFDYAGVGKSTGEVASTVRQSADNVLEFLALLGEKEVDVLGFSIGGTVAQLVTLNADPKVMKIRKLILAGTAASAGPDTVVTTHEDVSHWAGGPEVTLEGFQVLFFPKTREGKLASESWWQRIHERDASISGEEPSKWLSEGYADGGKGIQAQGQQIQAFGAVETSQGVEGSYDRLAQLDIPVLVANGLVRLPLWTN